MEQPEHDGKSANGYGHSDIEKQIIVIHFDPTPDRLSTRMSRGAHVSTRRRGKIFSLTFRPGSLIQ
jgi:hypothetical protein